MSFLTPPSRPSPVFIVLINLFGALALGAAGSPFVSIYGLVLLPWTYEVMHNRAIWLVLPVVYVPPVALGLGLRYFGLGDGVAILGVTVAFTSLTVLADRVLPEQAPSKTACPCCGYDLRGLDHERCPECASVCTPPASLSQIPEARCTEIAPLLEKLP